MGKTGHGLCHLIFFLVWGTMDLSASMPQIYIDFYGCFTFLGRLTFTNSYSRLLVCSLGLSGLEMENIA